MNLLLALASSITLTFTAPTERVDNTPLAAADISHYEIQQANSTCAASAGLFTAIATVPTTAPYVLRDVSIGPKCFRVLVQDKAGLRSDPSNLAEVKILAPPKATTISVVVKVTP
jgi:hypothetical protein